MSNSIKKQLPITSAIKNAFLYPAAIVVIAWEELLYKPTQWVGEKIAKFELVKKSENFIKSLPPAWALAMFLVPGAVLMPLKFGAMYLIANHHAILGAGIFLGAKIVGTAMATRIFQLVEPSIRKFSLINTSLDFVFEKKNRLKSYWLSSPAYAHYFTFKLNARQALEPFTQKLKDYKSQVSSLISSFSKNTLKNSSSSQLLQKEKAYIKNAFNFSTSNSNSNSSLNSTNNANTNHACLEVSKKAQVSPTQLSKVVNLKDYASTRQPPPSVSPDSSTCANQSDIASKRSHIDSTPSKPKL